MRIRTLASRVKTAVLSTVKPLTVEVAAPRIRGRALIERNARVLRRNPYCVHCTEGGFITLATQVDHKVPLHLGGPDTEDNLQGLCDPCHEEKTTAEARARADGSATTISASADPTPHPVIA